MFIGFIAGFLATIIFHQGVIEILFKTGMLAVKPYSMTPTHPFGIPSFISLSFWGGVWGILGLFIFRKFINHKYFWLMLAVFGGIIPPLFYCMAVMPAKHIDINTILYPPRLILMFTINFFWGAGTALISKFLLK